MKNKKFHCLFPKQIQILRNGKPETAYSLEMYGNKQGFMPTLRYTAMGISKYMSTPFGFDDLDEFVYPWTFWVSQNKEHEEVYLKYKKGYISKNHRVIKCEVTDKGIVVEWGYDETDKEFLAERGYKKPYVQSYRMVVTDIKKQLEDYKEIR